MVGCDWLHQETDIAFFELPQNFTRPSISLAPSWSIVMTAFDELNQVNQTEVKINRYNEMISLACELGSIAFLLAICFVSTSPDTSPFELAAMALPP